MDFAFCRRGGRGVERVHASVTAALIAARNGATILRVHDVSATADALKVWQAVAAVPMPKLEAAATAILRPDEN